MTNTIKPYLFCAKCLATWFRIRFIMTFGLVWSIVIMGVSGWQMRYDGGDAAALDPTGSMVDWYNNVCKSSPYMYLRPFYFTYSTTSDTTGTSWSRPSFCGWPETNSAFRVSVAVLSFVFTFALYFETHLSKIARTVWLIFALLYFSCFVLDANASITGAETCETGFDNTDLGFYLRKAGNSTFSGVSCTEMAPYAGLVVIDLVQVFTFYFIFECWAMTDDLYSDKGQSNHGTKPFHKDPEPDVKNPLQKA